MSQRLLHVIARGDQLPGITAVLRRDGFAVTPSTRGPGGIQVRVRMGTKDEARVEELVRKTAPSARFGVPGSPTMDLKGYRSGHA